ncbi:ParA family protein, partial [Leuconostoc falkenbergense]|uniref:ParA family protein n=1 Tax=Leuconostoc falkenbergense TaxID=2766470 RepID=UPI0035D41CE6
CETNENTQLAITTKGFSAVCSVRLILAIYLIYKDKFNLNIDVVGILPVLQNKKGTVDNAMLNMAKESFGDDLVFKSVIPHMERIKRFDITGITDKDRFDRKVMQTYEIATNEFIEKINTLEDAKHE